VDWDSFYEACFEDEPIQEIIDMINILSEEYAIIFCTGRRESVRYKTEIWIDEKMSLFSDYSLLMRSDGDFRHDQEVKPELLNNFLTAYAIDNGKVALILEDRNSMVKKWRELGYKCLQVAEGDF